MELEVFEFYLIVVNVIGFLAFVIYMLLYNYTADGQIDKFLTILSLIGGSAGIILAMLLFDRKAVKGNMMSRIFVACIFVIHIVVFLII